MPVRVFRHPFHGSTSPQRHPSAPRGARDRGSGNLSAPAPCHGSQQEDSDGSVVLASRVGALHSRFIGCSRPGRGGSRPTHGHPDWHHPDFLNGTVECGTTGWSRHGRLRLPHRWPQTTGLPGAGFALPTPVHGDSQTAHLHAVCGPGGPASGVEPGELCRGGEARVEVVWYSALK